MSKSTDDTPRVNDERPQWLKEMQTHYSRTGSYRPEDLNRVLGDQRQGVSVPMASQWPAAAKIGDS
jgi:hypothetical protein